MHKEMPSRQGSVKFVNPERNQFFVTVKKRVDQYFLDRRISKLGDRKLFLKTIILLLLYFAPFVVLNLLSPGWGVSLMLWTIMGIGMAGLGMSVMHDANHGAYTSNPGLNW